MKQDQHHRPAERRREDQQPSRWSTLRRWAKPALAAAAVLIAAVLLHRTLSNYSAADLAAAIAMAWCDCCHKRVSSTWQDSHCALSA